MKKIFIASVLLTVSALAEDFYLLADASKATCELRTESSVFTLTNNFEVVRISFGTNLPSGWTTISVMTRRQLLVADGHRSGLTAAQSNDCLRAISIIKTNSVVKPQ